MVCVHHVPLPGAGSFWVLVTEWVMGRWMSRLGLPIHFLSSDWRVGSSAFSGLHSVIPGSQPPLAPSNAHKNELKCRSI